jgi:hypothetical protein
VPYDNVYHLHIIPKDIPYLSLIFKPRYRCFHALQNYHHRSLVLVLEAHVHIHSVLGVFMGKSSSDGFSFVVSVDLVLDIFVLNTDLKEVKGCATEEKRELRSLDLSRTSLGRDAGYLCFV